MNSRFSWVVGASGDCDITIRDEAVSRRHCLLRLTPAGFVVKDLESTNGVYVNGVAIGGETAVKSSDAITLGKRVFLPWPKLDLPQREVTIGRASDNDIVLDFDNISARHACLKLNKEEIAIEDLGSTNGLYVGLPPQRVQQAKVSLDDVIGFGTREIPVAQLVLRAFAKDLPQSLEDATFDEQRARLANTRSHRAGDRAQPGAAPVPKAPVSPWVYAVAGAAACVLLLLPLFPQWFSASGVGKAEPAPVAVKTTEPVEPPVVSSTPVPPATSSIETAPAQVAATNVVPSGPLFLVVVGNSASDEKYRLGTAWAVEPATLVTAASVVQALQNAAFRERFPDAFIWALESDANHPIEKMDVHPRYRELRAAAEQQIAKYEQAVEAESQSAGKSHNSGTKAASDELFRECVAALERTVSFDVALLRFSQPVATQTLALAGDDTPLRVKLRLTVMGPAFDPEDPFFDVREPRTIAKLEGRVSSFPGTQPAEKQHLVCDTTAGHQSLNYLGCPIQNAAGHVVAIYCRPTPPLDATNILDGETFDAALWSSIRGLLKSKETP
jgi:pSer/pThr/pTyr-binding forkhead associated (FHA) protein